MVDSIDNFWDNEEDNDDEEIEVDECICSECGQEFEVPVDMELEECPLCGAVFDQ